ncbi:uncharacterized protein LOC129599700 [Paramacrobiotus metropolitanus]|uniref:uncharacterized protein LOC129599700 n=1 Tax=Paramacrobiotus metropolitanus TaxID=2943436 RepID=UPI002445915A|nr:uncharacterized protein LOC129599700 [Paramacrobiotus metropolitanus]
MYIYGGEDVRSHPVYAWNSVDVLTESGLFQHGEVIDVAENGLIVDFHCNEQRSQLVSYDKIFSASTAPCSAGYHIWYLELRKNPAVKENASVQVLWRAHPGAAWLWYPGRLLSKPMFFPFYVDLLIVQIQPGGWQSAELFPGQQVRFPPSREALAKRALRPNAFVVRECRLPKHNWLTGTDDRRRRQLKAWWSVRVVSVQNAVARLLQPSDARPLTKKNLVGQKRENDFALENECPRENIDHDDSGMPSRKKRKTDADSEQPDMDARIPTETHLLCEIFQSLDTTSRQKLRRVCPLWNTVLTGADSVHTVRVSFAMTPALIGVYGAVGSMFKCLHTTTQWLIVEHVGCGEVGAVLTVIGRMLRTFHIKEIVFHKVNFEWSESVDFPIADEVIVPEEQSQDVMQNIWRLAGVLKVWAAFCEALRLWRCEFRCMGQMAAVIPRATIPLDAADLPEQFWDLYEAHLARDGLELEYFAEKIRAGSAVFRHVVTELLEGYQSCDPRLTTHYRGKTWTEENLQDLDVSQLTTITLRALGGVVWRPRR